ncbi:MAG TPA: SRPBCC family protein [Bacteroidia bacterium]|jgi:uncharacterized protein YndB with AHSA1/START domain|nr:SRPBCC family protein [Bacteroidia bacterium]
MNNLIAKAEVIIDATPARIWKALTDPAEVKLYLFGTNLIVKEWKVGSDIQYKGEWMGKAYVDKGKILVYKPEELLITTYLSGISGKADIPENYQKVSYALTPLENKTKLTITQENIESEESKKHSEENWGKVLHEMKKVIEKSAVMH